MTWVFLSPHLDDAALSCGGFIYDQAQAGQLVSVWTICAGDPPTGPLSLFAEGLHARWGIAGQAMDQRRREDIEACQLLGAAHRHFRVADCIYRTGATGEPLYASEEAIFGSLHPDDQPLVYYLISTLKKNIPLHAQVVSPLTLGQHVDHQLTRAAAEQLEQQLWYYEDYPYVLNNHAVLEQIRREGWKETRYIVSEPGIRAWIEAVAAHRSQLSTFWEDRPAMELAIHHYASRGMVLWQRNAA